MSYRSPDDFEQKEGAVLEKEMWKKSTLKWRNEIKQFYMVNL